MEANEPAAPVTSSFMGQSLPSTSDARNVPDVVEHVRAAHHLPELVVRDGQHDRVVRPRRSLPA